MIFKLSKIALSFFIFIIFLGPVYSQGDLMIMPKRLVFDGNQRSEQIHLINTGKDSATYKLSFIQYKMNESGSFEQIENPEEGQKFASDFLRYFPRTVTLGPQEAQTVRVQLTKTNLLEPGEYRSHMYFRAVEKQNALKKSDQDSNQNVGLSLNIKTIFGISIPIIIRKGEYSSKVHFSDLILNQEKDAPEITMVINREGNISVYGNLNISHISPKGKIEELAFIKGIAVYTPNRKRIFTMPLKKLKSVNLLEGQLKIEYKEESGRLLGETLIDLN
jgi:hypothetical protein